MNSKKRRERKQIITLAVSVGVILLLVLVYFIVNNAATGDSEDTKSPGVDIGESGTFTIIEENYQYVTALSYKYNGEEVGLHIENSKWVLDDDAAFPVDQDKIVYMSQAISDYGGFSRIIYDSSRTSAYGTDDPMLDISVTYFESDGSSTYTRRFLVGNRNAVTGYYYFYETGSSYIYTVNDSLFPYFKYAKVDLFAETATPTPDVGDIKALSVEYDGGVYEYDAEVDGVVSEDDETSPVKLIMDAVPKAAHLQYPDLVAYGVDADGLSEYGLDDPSLRVVLTYNEYVASSTSDGYSSVQMTREREFVMLFGSRVTEGEGETLLEYVYVSEEGSGVVYKVSAERYDGIYSVVSNEE